jgi:thioredoxin 1
LARQFLKVLVPCAIFILGWFGQPSPAWPQNDPSPKSRPALLEFGAGYCHSCKVMAEIMAELQKTHGDRVEFRMVYTDKEQEMFKRYKIMLIPTQVFLNAAGQEVDRHIGALSKEEVLQKLRELKFIGN